MAKGAWNELRLEWPSRAPRRDQGLVGIERILKRLDMNRP